MRKSIVLRSRTMAGACLIAGWLAFLPAQARTADFGVRGGVYPDEEEPFLGGEALFSVGQGQRWFGNPNLEHVFADSGDLTAVSFDFHYDFLEGQPYAFWAGGGPTLIHKDRAGLGDGATTDAGVNLLLGLGARKGDVRPYGQFKVVLADDSEAVLGVGVRF